MVFYPKDYDFGTAEEERIHPSLINYFKREIRWKGGKAKHDYECDNFNYEMKSRTNCYDKYPTTMITENKICGDKGLILLFNFTDGLYYIQYDEEKFASYERKLFSRARMKWDEKVHLYIPIKDLTPLPLLDALTGDLDRNQ